VQAEEQVARWAADFSVRHVILRAPGIYASDRLPVDRLRAGLPTILDEEDSYSNHIHADDLAACALAAWTNSTAKGVFNVVDDSNLKMGAYFDLVADAMGMDRPPRVSRAEAHARVSAAMWSFMRESRRIRNERMKSELGYALKYPTVEVGLSALSDAARAAALATLDGTRRR
jgi:nucleoside-diphosphate-sugar epimerase